MHVDGRWTVRSMLPEDEYLPCTGTGSSMATLAAIGVAILRGNRSRILLIAAELEPLLEQVVGSLEVHVLRHGVPAGESSRVWSPARDGRLLVAKAFGAELVTVHRRDDAITPLPTAAFAGGEEIIFGMHSHVGATAEVVLIVELPTPKPKVPPLSKGNDT